MFSHSKLIMENKIVAKRKIKINKNIPKKGIGFPNVIKDKNNETLA